MIIKKICRKLKGLVYRRRLRKKSFFDNVNFVGIFEKENKKSIIDWLVYLYEYKDISINKFSDLFYQYEEIVFPITILNLVGKWPYCELKDNKAEKYYMLCNNVDYYSMQKYSIAKKREKLSEEYIYELTQNGKVELKEILFLPLDDNGKNSNRLISFKRTEFSNNTITLTDETLFAHLEFTIKYRYEEKKDMDDMKQMLQYLIDADVDKIAFDVFPILKHMVAIHNSKLEYLHITVNIFHGELLSELKVLDDMVQSYAFTAHEENSDIVTKKIQYTKEKSIGRFIEEYSKKSKDPT